MKKLISSIALLLIATLFVAAQEEKGDSLGYHFSIVKQVNCTPVTNQYRSGTCWSFSSLSFLEAELIRLGRGEFDLSEMFVVRHSYYDKAERYVRMHGALNFGGGGALNDMLNVIKKYGMVPEEAYTGLVIDEEKHIHGEMDGVLKAMVKDVIENKNTKLSPAWKVGYNGLLDAYLGKLPENFKVNGKTYTARTYADEVIKIIPDDYILVSSYTHHPFYSKFILEVPDNWSWGEIYNVPMTELTQIIDNAVNTGFTIGWAGDISEKGFSWSKGLAIVADEKVENLDGLEQGKWEELSEKEKSKMIYKFTTPRKEKVITQADRQLDFDNYTTTDDHGMHITGIAKDQTGTKYYLVKNSWGVEDHICKGYLYMSETFIQYKTTSIIIHKDALPKDIAKKLGL